MVHSRVFVGLVDVAPDPPRLSRSDAKNVASANGFMFISLIHCGDVWLEWHSDLRHLMAGSLDYASNLLEQSCEVAFLLPGRSLSALHAMIRNCEGWSNSFLLDQHDFVMTDWWVQTDTFAGQLTRSYVATKPTSIDIIQHMESILQQTCSHVTSQPSQRAPFVRTSARRDSAPNVTWYSPKNITQDVVGQWQWSWKTCHAGRKTWTRFLAKYE